MTKAADSVVRHLQPVERDNRGQLIRELEDGTRLVLIPAEAAAILGVDPRAIRRACETGELPAFRLGPKWFIPAQPFLELLRKGAA